MNDDTRKLNMMLTMDELRDLVGLIEKAEAERGKPYEPDAVLQIEQFLRPTRTITTARLPLQLPYLKIGSESSRI